MKTWIAIAALGIGGTVWAQDPPKPPAPPAPQEKQGLLGREVRLLLVPGTKGAARLDAPPRNRVGDARLKSPRLPAAHVVHDEVVDLEDPGEPAGSHGGDLEAC